MMRQILLGVITAFTPFGCSEKENLTFQKEIQNLSTPSQVFTITNEMVGTIEAKNGTRIIIPPNTFVFNDGQDVKESIQIELREVFDKSDMVLNGLGTVSDGRLLESLGMIYIKATSNGRELKIRDNGSVAISIPNRRQEHAGELFYGVQSGSSLNWKYAGPKKDTTEVITTTIPMAEGLASVKRTSYRYVNGLREFVSDTIFIIKYQCCQDFVAQDSAYDVPKSYEFEVTQLGWINCDQFIEVADKLNLQIELKNYSQPIGYLVFSDINSVMQVLFNMRGETTVTNLPANYQVNLIVLDNIKGDVMWAKQNIKIGTETKLTLETRKTNMNELKAKLKALDK